ncbi:hypothetical protein H4F38_21010 [Pectobacterium brasiliense]|uniref:hypothetical protein n=1 Tax=Pectobacterium brasiliense TaxID=180957 RepID=UPI00057FDD38|nr:hypothetical protein [Pectobacterium brasiliense]APS29278.1 hypothetical protein NC16_05865 [Pectobacterium brasiliense]KHT00612.1 hypothetical protein RC91_16245 [Pectobacterium brasiliense]MBN3100223.1 hypothetical protein [Pectobacterium brasiliense]MBN3103443.1 hypothetical protein [Pectobacterium brasiliense]MBN3167391.1 hypothetical protein [Pectobacterium brasiliense]
MNDRKIFVYVNTRDMVKVQSIEDVTTNGDYFQGTSLLDGDERKLKTFRTDRVIKFFDSIQNAENYINQGIDSGEFYIKKPKEETFDICFTGFKKERRAELEKIASSKNMIVRKSVTKHLKLLCYGYNAGPTKIRDARNMGILIFNEEQFMSFVETGEIAE